MQVHVQADGMRIKTIISVLVVILLFTNCLGLFSSIYPSGADEPLPKFYVDDDYDDSTPGWHIDHFDKIQDAIDNASESDRIIVYEGIYNENIIINKTSLNVFGEDKSLSIIDGGDSGNVVSIYNASVDISSFTIRDSGSSSTNAGIYVSASSCTIVDNIITSGKHGIYVDNSNSHVIYVNTISSNTGDGIYLNNSDSCSITYNTITGNSNGIFLYSSSSNTISSNPSIKQNSINGIFLNESCTSNTISSNNISSNTKNGIYLNNHCNNNPISSNDVYSNGGCGIRIENSSLNLGIASNTIISNTNYGIMIVGSTNKVDANTIAKNGKHGLFLFADDNNTIEDNAIYSNTYDGIRMHNSTDDSVYRNEIYGNSIYGIYLNYYTIDNQINNNYFHDNTQNAMDISLSANSWNISKTPGTNIVGGDNISGNYWDDYDEASEGAYDTNGDDIVDSAYTIYASNKDNGPLIDATDPIIGVVKATPTTKYSGEITNISAAVTDTYLGVEEVYLVYTDSNGQTTNISITQNKTGNTYYCGKSFTTVGSYSYYIAARDKRNWKSSSSRSFEILPAADTEPPTILVVDHGPSFDEIPNSHTFGVIVTDNIEVANVTIEYWYNGSDKMTVDMENTAVSYYEKVINPQGTPDKVYCVIYANDTSGNQQNTKNPYADADGPYVGYVATEILFDGMDSFDLDGNISTYTWNFGDGTTDVGISPKHAYLAKGTYTVRLTVTDNDGNTNTTTTTATVSPFTKVTASDDTVDLVGAYFDVTLSDVFYCHDTNGDEIVDTFTDPNGILTLGYYVNISGHASFLLSVNDDMEKLFIWDTEDDDIINVTYSIATITSTVTSVVERTITVTVTVDKSSWTYINLTDPYPDNENLTVKASNGTTISEDRIWRTNETIFVLDDPSTVYYFIYAFNPPPLDHPSFTIPDGGTINESNPTITVIYTTTVTIIRAEFYNFDTKETHVIGLNTTDDKTFTYTPPATFESGQYEFYVRARDEYGQNVNDSMVYNFVSYGKEETKEEASYDALILFLGGIIVIGIALFLLLRYKHITLESFIYFRNRKIIPFFKPVVFGPLSIDVDDKQVKKAEFYVNGQLKDTLTEAPYVWRWNEGAFMKQVIETKVYDEEGNEHSSEGMTFYVFNSPRLFK